MKRSISTVFQGAALLLLLASLVVFTGCVKEQDQVTAQELLDQALAAVDQTRLAADLAAIDDSLEMRGLQDRVEIEPNGVRYIVDTLGTGITPTLESAIRIKYSGRLLKTNAQFDSSNDAVFNLFRLIIGFQTTIPRLPVGSKATLYIPSGYGYGPEDSFDGAGNVVIPKNSNLVFAVEILDAL
jgi:FKBP-type peptidyl-prolyl cis-trans isomerase